MLVNKHWAPCLEPGQTFHTFRVFMEQEVDALAQPWMKDFFQLDQIDWEQLEETRKLLGH